MITLRLGVRPNMASLMTLPPHLLDSIRSILAAEVILPEDLGSQLEEASRTIPEPTSSSIPLESEKRTSHSQTEVQSLGTNPLEEDPPPTIDIELLERLSRWAASDQGTLALQAGGLGENSERRIGGVY